MKKLITSLAMLVASAVFASPITLVTMTGAGSLSDTAARQVAPAIERHTGRPVVVVNAPGGEGLIAVNKLQAAPQGATTLLVGNSALGYLRATRGLEVPLEPLAGLTKSSMAVFVPATSAAKVLPDLSEGEPLVAVTSPMVRMSVRLLDQEYQLNSRQVGYTQFGQAVVDLSQARIDYLLAPVGVGAVEGMLKAGKVRQLADLGPQFTWSAFYAPKGHVDPQLAAQLQAAVKETSFVRVQSFVADADEVRRVEADEAALMRKALVK